MEVDAIMQLIETDEKTRDFIQKQYQLRNENKQAVEDEKKRISDEAWKEVHQKVEETKKELDARIEQDKKENECGYQKSVKRINEMYEANKDTWREELVKRILTVEE